VVWAKLNLISDRGYKAFAEYGGDVASFCLPPYFIWGQGRRMKGQLSGTGKEPVSD
jgi:hypothetical protein